MRRAPRGRDIETIKNLLRSGEGARALQTVGDRWSFLLLRDAFLGVRRFEDLRRLTGASRGTLTARLNALVEQGILYRSPYGDAPSRLEYRLTEKGLAFYPVALCMWIWENRWGGEFGLPPQLVHAACGKALNPVLACSHCDARVVAHDVEFEPGPGAPHYAAASRTTRRRQGPAASPGDGVDTTMFHSVDTVGDRWTALLVAALFFGLHRYDDINAALGIATNILADRLRRLLDAGVIEQHLYQERPPRYEYRMTAKGWDLFPFTIALHDWGSHWIASPHGPGLKLRHTPCDHRLRGQMVCGSCGEAITPQQVQIRGATRWAA
ncbi:MAG: winged helix-turn-helix transcriptional regulator, partial [Hyphomonadaceae bacterium]